MQTKKKKKTKKKKQRSSKKTLQAIFKLAKNNQKRQCWFEAETQQHSWRKILHASQAISDLQSTQARASRSLAFWKKLKIFHTFTQNQPKKMAMLIRSKNSSSVNKSSRFHKSQVNTEEQLQAAKQRFHHNRCKNKSSSENRRIFLPQFYTEAMRSSQVLTHARTRSCSTHHLRVWEHVQVKESTTFVSEITSSVSRWSSHLV